MSPAAPARGRVPVAATIIVAAAVAVMIALGVWQVQRAQWKEGLLRDYATASRQPTIAWPSAPRRDNMLPLFRRAAGDCLEPEVTKAVAGQNRSGETGYVFFADCAAAAGKPPMRVQLGWSRDPTARFDWPGGPVSGIIAPDQQVGMRLVADAAPRGLEPSARPSLSAIRNNHRLYAIQWFAFAGIAALIYGLALRSRWRLAR